MGLHEGRDLAEEGSTRRQPPGKRGNRIAHERQSLHDDKVFDKGQFGPLTSQFS